ncbi:MAG: HAMP domain-containing protein, partial [Lysobacteraceae bacterium]
MYTKHNSPLVDRLLGPSTRLMARFRFGQKAMVIGASFVVTCAVLAGFVIKEIHDNVASAQLAQSAMHPADKLFDAMVGMQQHRSLVLGQSFKVAASAGDLDQSRAMVDEGFSTVEGWERAHVGKPSPALTAARAAWAKALGQHADAAAAVADHDAAITRARLLMRTLDDESSMALTADPSVYYLSRAVMELMPMLSEYSSRQSLVATRVSGEGAIWAEDRANLAVADAMAEYQLNNMTATESQIAGHDARLAAVFKAPIARVRKTLDDQGALIKKHVLDAETPDMAVPAMVASAAATRHSLNQSYDDLNSALAKAADAYVHGLKRDATTVACVIAFALLLTAYLFLGFSRNTRTALGTIEEAALMLARGQFPDRVRVDSQDELRGIGDSMERAVKTLRRFEEAQRGLFQAHQAGQISERLDTESFDGAFGVMADEINTLVASHIEGQMRVIDVVSQYARGDLSQDIERYPGEKARITEAVDAVKAGTLAVNAEIKALVDAAV